MIQQMIHFMQGCFPVLFRMSLTAGIMVLLVLAVRALFQKMGMPKIFSYALWGIVLFRLLCPVSFSAPFSILTLVPRLSQESKKTLPDTSGNADYVLSEPIHADTTAPVGSFEIQVSLEPALDSGENNTDLRTPSVSSDNNAENDFHISVETIGTDAALPDKDTTAGTTQTGIFTALTILWLTGIAVVLTVNLRSYHKLKKKAACSVRLSGNIYLADKIGTPCCLGLFFPKIYLPSALSDKEQAYVILHEKHHLERLDYLIKPTAFLALCLHWFNPLVWVAFVLAGRDMEMSCDEAVLKKMEGDIRAEYATSLVRLTAGAGVFSVSSLAFGGNNPKQRIRNIMNYKKHGRLSTITACIICVAVAGCAVSNPNPQKKEPVDNEVLQTVIPTPSPKQTEPAWKTEPSKTAEPTGKIEPSGKAEPAGETDRNSYKGYVWDDEYYFINENGRVVKKADNQETDICVFFRDDYENVLHMSGAVKEQFEGLFDETNLVAANRIVLKDIDENGQQECAWLLSFGASRIMGPFFQLAFEWNGEIIYIHEEPAMTQMSIRDTVACLDLDHDGAKEILLTLLPHANSRSLTEFAVLKQCSDGSWKNLENPATHFETTGNHVTNSFPITVKKSEHPHTAMISCEGLDKTIFYDTQNYCNIWMDCDHGSGCTCGCQAKQHHNDDHHGNEKHHGNGYNTSVSSRQLTPEGKIVNYYLNEFPRLATGETCGGTCAWGIREIRQDTCNKIPCLVATQGIEGRDQQQPWGTADIYFDYDSNGTIRILDMKFAEWIN